MLSRRERGGGTETWRWQRKALHLDLNLIPPSSILMPPYQGGLIDGIEAEVGPLEQGSSVHEPYSHTIVLREDQPPP